MQSYDIAAKVGWNEVFKSMKRYDLLPKAFFEDPNAQVARLKSSLLGGGR